MVRKRQNTVIRQGQIIDAARKLIIKYGSEHVTVSRIAKGVGISEAAIYRHFKSKRDILSLLVEHIEASLVKDITITRAEGQTPLELLDSILRSHISAIERRRGISFQVIAEIVSLGDKKLNKKVSNTINKYISYIKGLLSEGVKNGEVRENIDLEAAAMLLFSMIQGLVNIWTLSNYKFDPEEKYVSLWSTFREAIVKCET
jgi:AcrR family transcriptional regulator